MCMAPIPVVVPVCVMTLRDVVRPSVQSALRDCLRWTYRTEGIALPLRAMLRGTDRFGRPSKTGCLDDG